MEVTQFTHFQQVGGLECKPVTGEITYGLERLAMYIRGVTAFTTRLERWPVGKTFSPTVTFHQNEVEQSTYNFEYADVDFLFTCFGAVRRKKPSATKALENPLPPGLRAYS